ncbi:hypothetical protein SAMN05192559_10461 [Halobacillus karajensis]|nr:hypothetical protein SAMN05192559_10461 [Halobacillus karajensis]
MESTDSCSELEKYELKKKLLIEIYEEVQERQGEAHDPGSN